MNERLVAGRDRLSVPQSERPRVSQKNRPAANLDFIKIAWDAKWLLLVGTLVGLGAGYLQFIKSKPMYRSMAQVQIVESMARNIPVDAIDSGLKSRNFGDEALVMRSEQILRRAAEIGELSSTPEFSGVQPEQIASFIGSESLTIGPAVDSVNTSVYQIQYDSTSSSTSRRVVQAVIDAYAVHLTEQYRNVGQETIDLIQQARTEVLAKLNKLESEFSDFKKHSGLIYRGNETNSIHRDNADRYTTQRQELSIRKARLIGVLTSAKHAMEQKRPNEAVLLALNAASTVHSLDGASSNGLSLESSWELEKIKRKPLLSAAERMRQEKLLPLEIERETLVASVGSDHPAIETIDRRIAIIEKTIESVRETEHELDMELDKAMIAANAELTGAQVAAEDPQQRLRQQIEFVVGSLRQQMDAIDAELDVISASYATEMEAARMESDGEIQSAEYVREIGRQQQLYDRIVARLDEVSLISGGDGLKVFPLNSPKPGYQFAPSLAKSLLMGGFLGCMFAAGLALLREMSDRSYHSAREIAEHTRLPIIGHVPVLKSYQPAEGEPGQKLDPRLVTFFNGKGQRAESFRALRTAIFFSNQAGDNQILQVTSAMPSDGKTTIAANIAIAIAQSGRSVLLMDGDLRRPRVGKAMGIDNEKGTAWAINRCVGCESDAEIAIQEAINETEIANLSVMTAGEKPDNPSELLSSPGFAQLLNLLRTKFDIIILDTPPLLSVSDPANVAPRVDGVMMVVRLRKNIKPAVAQATRMLETLEANVLGIVVNGVGSRAARGYGKDSNAEGDYNYGSSYQYGYGYSYGYTYGYTDNDKNNKYYEERSSTNRGKKKRSSRNPTKDHASESVATSSTAPSKNGAKT